MSSVSNSRNSNSSGRKSNSLNKQSTSLNKSNSPKIVKINLQQQFESKKHLINQTLPEQQNNLNYKNKQTLPKKAKGKVEIPKRKYSSPQINSIIKQKQQNDQKTIKLQKTFDINKKMFQSQYKEQKPNQFKQLSVSQLKQQDENIKNSILIQQSNFHQQNQQNDEVNEFSFSQEPQSQVNKIQGDGYEILWKQSHQTYPSYKSIMQKINYMHIKVVIKIFQLCDKDYSYEKIVLHDIEKLSGNIKKVLKSIYGTKNEQLIIKKQVKVKQLLKTVFYRKRQIQISQLLFYLFDCKIMDQVMNIFVQLYPIITKY